MAPKNKGKKGKKQDDDDFWCVRAPYLAHTLFTSLIRSRETAGTSVANNNASSSQDAGAASDDDFKPAAKAGFSAFSALGGDDGDAAPDEGEDFGGLMVRAHERILVYSLPHADLLL